jgi:hypothetical protein
MAESDRKLILEIEVDGFNTQGMQACLEDVGEPDTALVDYLQDDLMKREVALGLGAFLGEDWEIVGRTGYIVGARLSEGNGDGRE